MADLSRLIVAGNQAANACDAAPLLVRAYLKPLREFVGEVVTTLAELNKEHCLHMGVTEKLTHVTCSISDDLNRADDQLMTLQLNAKKLEIERQRYLDLYRGIFNSTPVLEGAMREIGVPPALLDLMKQELNAQTAGGSEAGDNTKEL